MKHYLSYDAKGNLVGVHVHRFAATGLGGWPDTHRFEDSNSDHPVVQNMRQQVIGGTSGAIEFIPYDCPCPPTAFEACSCHSARLGDSRIVDGRLVAKKTGAFVIDGSSTPSGATIKRPPGTVFSVKIASSGAEDGSTAVVKQYGQAMILDAEESLSIKFAKEMSDPFEVTSPAQGLVGQVLVSGPDLVGLILTVRGWGA